MRHISVSTLSSRYQALSVVKMPWGYNRKVVHTATTSQLFLIVIIQDGNGNLSLKEFKKLIRPALDHIFVCEGDEEFEGIQIGRKILESQNLTKMSI